MQLSRGDIRELYKHYANSGMATMMSLINFDKRFVRAKGVSVWDDEGNEYLDFLGGYGALNFGHNHPQITEAVQQAGELPNLLQASLGPLYAALAYNLALVTPDGLCRTFFGNSGAEAVEGALKLARAATGKKKLIYCEGGFHGKTMGALSVTGRDKYKDPFRPLIPECAAVPYAAADALEDELKKGDAACFIVEPIQGEGGILIPRDGFLKEAYQLCKENNVLFIADEIQTGFGRTGKKFAVEWEGVTPDIYVLGKALGGGVMPVSAVAADKEILGVFEPGSHGSTFGGNPLACACAIAALEVIEEENLVERAKEMGDYFMGRLKEIKNPVIKEVRGRGLLVGVELTEDARPYCMKLKDEGVLCFETHYTVIRFAPPLVITKEEIDWAMERIKKVFA
ncbi:MAG TPA: ornithine--oxo-acid transaminase [Peptococcaceae bacterium]|nr:ornithine--oxo-acid transaminase [Peptococcaceae bacterium]